MQCEGGETIDSFFGTRKPTTLKNDPNTTPNSPKITVYTTSTSTPPIKNTRYTQQAIVLHNKTPSIEFPTE